jgi:hypothetical protein
LNERIALLGTHGEVLRGDTVGRHLRARHDSPRAGAAVSLIELSRIPLHTDVAAAAEADADQIEGLPADIADHHDIKVLRQAAAVPTEEATQAARPQLAVPVSFYLGVTLLDDEVDPQVAAHGRELIAVAVEAAPTRVPDWLRLCEQLAPAKPQFREAAGILEGLAGEDG